jgi:hypothetical protein
MSEMTWVASFEIFSHSPEKCSPRKEGLTNMMVTMVKTRMVLPCREVSSACSRPDLASEMLACFCFRSRRMLTYSDFR